MLGKSIAAALFTFFVLASYASERPETDVTGGEGRAAAEIIGELGGPGKPGAGEGEGE